MQWKKYPTCEQYVWLLFMKFAQRILSSKKNPFNHRNHSPNKLIYIYLISRWDLNQIILMAWVPYMLDVA